MLSVDLPAAAAGPLENIAQTQYKMGSLVTSECPKVPECKAKQSNTPMISVAAIRMQQFGVQFYQASLSASDIDKLVRFEVLSYGEQSQPVRGGRKKVPAPTKVNWDLLETADCGEREGVSAPNHPQED